MPRCCVRYEVVVLGGHGARDADRADDPAVLRQWDGASSEHELVVGEPCYVAGEKVAAAAEARLEISRGRSERRCGVGLGPRDLGCHPERAIHAMARHQMSGLVHHGEGHPKAEVTGLGDAAVDAEDGLIQCERHGISTHTWPASTLTGYDATLAPRPGNAH